MSFLMNCVTCFPPQRALLFPVDSLLHDCLSVGRRLTKATNPLLTNTTIVEASPPQFSGSFIRLKRRKPNSSGQPLQERSFRIKSSKEAKWQGSLVYVGSTWKRHEVKGLHLQARACSSEAAASKMEDRLPQKGRRKKKHSPESEMSWELDMCSKRGDLNGALAIFDKVTQDGVLKLRQQNYNVLLYLCSAAATGALKPENDDRLSDSLGEQTVHINSEANSSGAQSELLAANGIRQSGIMDTKARDFALLRGFEIYDQMQREGVPWNEATLTAVARLAVAKGDGDMAFEMVKRMAAASIAPRLRSYGPALYTYCRNKELEKAFEVDAHMLASGVHPEESELAALLKVSVDAGRQDKVYLLLHRLRTTVRELSPSTVEIVEHWFKSKAASRAGEQSWENQPTIGEIEESIEAKGGGWHGLGWLGKGKWDVERTNIDKNGSCLCCRERLCTIDIDPLETEDFAKSVAELACQREVEPNKFKAFQSWLDKQLPYEAVVDGANIGLYQQNFADGGFNFHQLRAIITAIQARSPNKRLPLVILHKRRTQGRAASSPTGKELLKKLMEADSLYASPLGSNDDWYWLYAAVKCKCLLVTNDELRDHLFQLLGNDFFPKWKERHQVRFSFKRLGNMELHMPPPYSIVIQESSNGSWHVPQSGGDNIEVPREWLCIRRKPGKNTVTSVNIEPVLKKQCSLPSSERDCRQLSPSINLPNSFDVGKNLQVRQVSSVSSEILLKLEAAEKTADSPIDFQI